MATDQAMCAWLLDSDPALRWQVLRDVVGASEAEVVGGRLLPGGLRR